MNRFEEWYSRITESSSVPKEKNVKPHDASNEDSSSVATSTIEAPTETSQSRAEIISDVDSIMNTLSKLSVQIKECLEFLNIFEEADIDEELDSLDEEYDRILEKGYGDSGIGDTLKSAGSSLANWIYYAPKYRNMQKKINKMLLNLTDIKLAIDALGKGKENEAKVQNLTNKKQHLETNITSLQKDVDDKAKERGEYIQRVLQTEKIKGKMEMIKRISGQEDNPSKKKELADSFKELNDRLASEQQAIKHLQDKEKEKEMSSNQDKKSPEKEEEPTRNAEEPKKEEKPSPVPSKETELAADIKKYNNNIAAERQAMEKAKEELKTEKDPDKIAKLKNSIDMSKEDIKEMQDEVKKLKDELKKVSSPKESLVLAATELGLNEMASEIQSKFDWQFENNSALYVKYKMEIDKHTNIKKLNESYSTSISDKFRTLLG